MRAVGALTFALLAFACNQRDAPPAAEAAPPPSSRPDVARPEAAAIAAAAPDAAPPDAARPPAATTPGRAHEDSIRLEEPASRLADSLFADDGSTGSAVKGRDRRPPGTDLAQQIGRSHADDPTPAAIPPGRITITGKRAVDVSSLDIGTVSTKIAATYLAGVRRCYRELLTRNPTAGGDAMVSFTVGETGRASDPHVTGFDLQMSTCVADQIRAWRFPAPRNGRGEPTVSELELELRFAPS